ncbi:hypothetical protein CGRA01v4_04467 [Colletotrichum graminicola]|nr:hypothetical protein CGRA01v4_04467 [Colletotrichum graminicola]
MWTPKVLTGFGWGEYIHMSAGTHRLGDCIQCTFSYEFGLPKVNGVLSHS